MNRLLVPSQFIVQYKYLKLELKSDVSYKINANKVDHQKT